MSVSRSMQSFPPPTFGVYYMLGGSESSGVTNDLHQICIRIRRKDNEHEEKPEHGTESRTTTNRLAQIEVVQCGRRMVEIGRCLSNESCWGLVCLDNQQRQRPDFLPRP